MEIFKHLIENLNLKEHPEGGFYKEVFRSNLKIKKEFLQLKYKNDRCLFTSIYFLLYGNKFYAFHKLKSDEIWHFYEGTRLLIHIIENKYSVKTIRLGDDLENGDTFQTVIKSGHWFAAEVEDKNSYSLVGCTVSPGFEYDDFELGKRSRLIRLYPKHKKIIERLTR